MPALTPGKDFEVWAATLYWAPRYTELPAVDLAFGGTWPVGWTKIEDTVNGIGITHRAAREPVVSEERKQIGSVPAGGGGGGGRGGGGGGGGGGGRGGGQAAGTAIAFEALAFTDDFWRFSNSMSEILAVAQAAKYSLTITTAASSAGNVTVTLPGLSPVNVAVLSTDTTTAGVATKIAGGTYTGWTAAVDGSNASKVNFTATTNGPKVGTASFSGGTTGVASTAGLVKTQHGHWGVSISYVDSDVEHQIMIGIEAKTKAGGIYGVEYLRRGIGFRCENNQNGEDLFKRTGRDSVVTPNLVLECIPEQIQAAQLTNTGLTADQMDPDSKFIYVDTPTADPSL